MSYARGVNGRMIHEKPMKGVYVNMNDYPMSVKITNLFLYVRLSMRPGGIRDRDAAAMLGTTFQTIARYRADIKNNLKWGTFVKEKSPDAERVSCWRLVPAPKGDLVGMASAVMSAIASLE